MADKSPNLASLAASVTEGLNALTTHFKTSGQPLPSFAEDSPPSYSFPPDVAGLKVQLLEQLHDLTLLIQGPNDALGFVPLLANHDQMTLDMLNQFDFYHAVPLGGSATYTEIAAKINLPEDIVRRFLRHAFTQRIFAEAKPGSDTVVHTAMSAHHARTPSLFSWHRHLLQEIRPGTVYVPEAIRRGTSEDGRAFREDDSLAGFSLADLDRTGKPPRWWDYLKGTSPSEPEGYRSKQFAGAMEFLTQSSKATATNPVIAGFDWGSVGSGTVVDVGGSSGHDAAILAEAFPTLTFIVQDLPENEPSFKAHVPQELTSRLTFQAHDFFKPQPVKADVFFLKTILHDWDDEQSVKIVRNLLPSLNEGGRIVLTEVVVPANDDPVPWVLRKAASAGDLQMLVAFNGRDRSLKQWGAVLKKADSRLVIRDVKMVPGSWRSVMEVALDWSLAKISQPERDNTPRPFKVAEIGKIAEPKINSAYRAYYKTGADDEQTIACNTKIYDGLLFRSRMLRDVSTVDTSTTIFGRYYDFSTVVKPDTRSSLGSMTSWTPPVRARLAKS